MTRAADDAPPRPPRISRGRQRAAPVRPAQAGLCSHRRRRARASSGGAAAAAMLSAPGGQSTRVQPRSPLGGARRRARAARPAGTRHFCRPVRCAAPPTRHFATSLSVVAARAPEAVAGALARHPRTDLQRFHVLTSPGTLAAAYSRKRLQPASRATAALLDSVGMSRGKHAPPASTLPGTPAGRPRGPGGVRAGGHRHSG